jgi:flagellar motor switch protein FliN
VKQINPSVQSLFDILASEIQSLLFPGHAANASASQASGEDRTPSDLIWWSWSLSIDATSCVLTGASLEAWIEICGLDADTAAADFGSESLAMLAPAIEKAARSKFGSEVTCGAPESSEEPPRGWTSVPFTIDSVSGAELPVYFSVSPDLEAALGGGPVSDTEALEGQDLAPAVPAGMNSADILMYVEMPVTIVLGRTKMRLKDLLKLTNGSVVELDQMLDDEVEVRVNNCVIAYGEVVAVDGNYAVRILRMAAARNNPDLRGALPGKAA